MTRMKGVNFHASVRSVSGSSQANCAKILLKSSFAARLCCFPITMLYSHLNLMLSSGSETRPFLFFSQESNFAGLLPSFSSCTARRRLLILHLAYLIRKVVSKCL